uniref:Uncharacterized protein n=1 Tax=Arundo donax TaxID=35708 RepID=A0A0A9HHI8_ARUDO
MLGGKLGGRRKTRVGEFELGGGGNGGTHRWSEMGKKITGYGERARKGGEDKGALPGFVVAHAGHGEHRQGSPPAWHARPARPTGRRQRVQ